MKFVSSVLLFGAALAISSPASASATSTTKPIPVVATHFSNLNPKVEQRETVTVQFYLYRPKKHPQYLSGAHLSVTLKLGTMKVGTTVLTTVKGTVTNKQGKAYARFTVPRKAKGKVLWAYTTVSYKGALHMGSNRVRVIK